MHAMHARRLNGTRPSALLHRLRPRTTHHALRITHAASRPSLHPSPHPTSSTSRQHVERVAREATSPLALTPARGSASPSRRPAAPASHCPAWLRGLLPSRTGWYMQASMLLLGLISCVQGADFSGGCPAIGNGYAMPDHHPVISVRARHQSLHSRASLTLVVSLT